MKRIGRLLRTANAARLGTYLLALWKLFQHAETPRAVKWVAVAVLAYAVSPIDLIPDFIPVLGYVDDVLLLPALIWLTIKLLPPEVLAQCRREADEWMRTEGARPTSKAGAVIIVSLWIASAVATWWWLRPHL